MKPFLFLLFTFLVRVVIAQSFLPPILPWKGKSESLILNSKDEWITPAEKSDFVETPGYQQTMDWLAKLCRASTLLEMRSIGKSPEGRAIQMVVASTDSDRSPKALSSSPKPLFLVQAGIHSGEIDGKDAGLMLLRDIAMKGKANLLEKVNLLFIPILNVDGHERSSPFNRPNQRGPANMGWRTNAQNLNLNRDYTKLDTKEIRAVIDVINVYDPDLYMDIHVTDGVDYQYDITYSFIGSHGHSPAGSHWLDAVFRPGVDMDLKAMGHIPGPFLNATNWRDFSEGNSEFTLGPNFSNSYGDLRHLPSILVENHSLKPYKQRVLGTYVLLEASLKLLAREQNSLFQSIEEDKGRRDAQIPIEWKPTDPKSAVKDSMVLLGIQSEIRTSEISGGQFVAWSGKPETKKVPFFKADQASKFLNRPKGYWIPALYSEVLERLKMHGINMTVIENPIEADVEMYRILEPVFSKMPFEGRIQVNGKPTLEPHKMKLPAGSAWVSTDQPLGDLAMVLLEPFAAESFLQWGFFHSIFQRTEYAEDYFLEPMARQMLENSPALKVEFEAKKKAEPAFTANSQAIFSWFYAKSPYYDPTFLLYPIGRVVSKKVMD